MLDYDYIKNHYRLIAVDSTRQKESDADPKAIQQTEFVGQLKKLDDNYNATDAGNDQSIIVLTNIRKNQRNKIKIFSRRSSSIIKDGKLSGSEI